MISAIEVKNRYTGHTQSIYAIAANYNSNLFYSSAADGLIVQWAINQPDVGSAIARVDHPVYSLFVDEDDKTIVAGSSKGNLFVLDAHAKVVSRNIEAHEGGVFAIVKNNEMLFTGGEDGCLKIWLWPTLALVKSIKLSDKSVRSIAINNNLIALGLSDHSVRILDKNNFKELHSINEHSNSVFAVAFGSNQTLLSGGRDAMLNCYHINNYRLVLTHPAHLYHINDIKYNTANGLIATASMDKTIKIWQASDVKLLKVLDYARYKSHTNSINKIIWLSENTFLSCSDDKQILLWEISFSS